MKRKLKNISIINTGTYIRKKAIEEADAYQINIKDIDSDAEIKDSIKKTISSKDISDKYHLQDGDILLASRGKSLKAAVFDLKKDEVCIASNSFLTIRLTTDKVLSKYVQWFLNLPKIQKYLLRLAQGKGSIPYLNKKKIQELNVPIINIDEQKVIIKLNRLIKEEQSLYKKLTESRKKLYDSIMYKNTQNEESQ